MRNTAKGIAAEIAKGAFRPHTALTNMALAYYQNPANYFAKSLFPVCPVDLSSDNYYIFDKDDLLRDSWQRKPAYGKVAPAVVSEHTDTYNCGPMSRKSTN
uniref:Major capsid protein n=1 Tax=Siphoviridae sp. ctu061 TaxID=2825710 RepID=A0A8S5U6N9_9CAUD|nr:MAG TPA: Major capsid protein [Siphoviridae sp. ctu061]